MDYEQRSLIMNVHSQLINQLSTSQQINQHFKRKSQRKVELNDFLQYN